MRETFQDLQNCHFRFKIGKMYEALTAMVFKSKICQNNIRDVMRPKTPLQMQGTTRHWDQGEEKDKEDLLMV